MRLHLGIQPDHLHLYPLGQSLIQILDIHIDAQMLFAFNLFAVVSYQQLHLPFSIILYGHLGNPLSLVQVPVLIKVRFDWCWAVRQGML